MIKQFKEINFGSYKDFKWKWADEKYNFNKINIIYGRNYSGKTTLSRIARSFELKNIHKDFGGSSFKVSLENGEITEKDIKNQPLNIKVYNSDFVKDNLSYLYDDNGDIKGFASIGKEQKDTKKQIEIIKNTIGCKSNEQEQTRALGLYADLEDLQSKKNSLENEKKRNETNLKTIKSIFAKQISDNAIIYNIPKYSITHLEKDIKKINNDNYNFSENTIEEYEKTLEDKEKENIKISEFDKSCFQKLLKDANDTLEKKIITKVEIEKDLRDWLEKGIDIHGSHSEGQKCKFCDNFLSADRINWLITNIKDDSQGAEDIKNKVNELSNRVKNLEKYLNDFLSINASSFYSEYEQKFNALKNNFDNLKASYIKELAKIKDALIKKENDIFNPITLDNQIRDFSDDIYKVYENINELCKNNNNYTSELSSRKKEIREKLRLNKVLCFINENDYYKLEKEIDDKKAEIQKIIGNNEENGQENDKKTISFVDGEIKKQEALLAKLEEKLSKLDISANRINEYLKSYFGHNALELRIKNNEQDSSKDFDIYRNEEPAKNLSEGECSLVAFCYFIATLKAENNTLKPIIWIDDPISSLDNNHIFYIFSLIENEIANKNLFEQLFISTHNLDFLKYLKRLEVKNLDKENTSYYFIEKNINENGETSEIKELPKYLKKYTTEFNYLFEQIYKFRNFSDEYSEDLKATLVYNFGNNLRKFLEIYLFFKYPNNFNNLNKNQIETFFKDTYQDDEFEENKRVIASIINRYQNEYSHLREIPDRGMQPIDIEETKKIASFILDTMKKNDEKQYKALEDSILNSSDTTTNNEQSKKGKK